MKIDVKGLNDNICKNCKSLTIIKKKSKNDYDEEIFVYECANKEKCKQLYKYIEDNDLLNNKLRID